MKKVILLVLVLGSMALGAMTNSFKQGPSHDPYFWRWPNGAGCKHFVDVEDILEGTDAWPGDLLLENSDTLSNSTDDTLDFASNDSNSTLQVTGFEAMEARLALIADQNDDAGDSWEIAASTSETLTIGNDTATIGTYVDKLTIAGSTGNVTLTGDIVNENADTVVMSNDDVLQFTSNDASATIQVLGFEAQSAILSLDADEADDDADTWTHTVADDGAYTIANEGTATMTINEKVALGAGMELSVALLPDSAAADIYDANTGKVHILRDLTQNSTFDLPAESAGLFYPVKYCGGAAEAHDHIFDTENDTNYFIGGVMWVDPNSGGNAETTAVYSDGDSNSKLTVNNAEAGTKIDFHSDGTNWYVSGVIYSDTTPTFTDQ